MRDYRGKRVDGKGWVEGCLLHYGNSSWIFTTHETEEDSKDIYMRRFNGFPIFEVIPESVGQYIGRKAKKKKLYEKDVFYVTDGDDWIIGKHLALMDGVTLSIHQDCIDKILGNTIDNPELLEEIT